MGTAVISATDLFRRRDFDPRRKLQAPGSAEFAGQFASIGHMNGHLRKRRGPDPEASRRVGMRPAKIVPHIKRG
jgi:hypothetical protein